MNTNQKKANIAILIPDKADLKARIIRDKERHFLMKKRLIHQEYIRILNWYALHKKTSRCKKQNFEQ